jgi:hypothetical protein
MLVVGSYIHDRCDSFLQRPLLLLILALLMFDQPRGGSSTSPRVHKFVSYLIGFMKFRGKLEWAPFADRPIVL